MELNLQRQMITIQEVIYDGSVEQPVECDALLPDYCPDIVKVLKCSVCSHISSSTINGDRLTIEGTAIAHIYYTPESNAIRHVDYKIPFTKSVDLRHAPNSPEIAVVPSVDYVNCRAVNQRRIDIRGAISFGVKVTDHKPEEVVCSAHGGGLQIKQDMLHTTESLGHTESQFSVNEVLDIGYGKPAVGTIIRTDCRVNMQDYKIVAGKVVAKGDLMVHVCYQPQGEECMLETMEYSMPISQIIDSDSADDQCVCDVNMYVLACDIQPKTNEDGEYRSFDLTARIKAVVSAYRHIETPIASDCYSTKYDCKCSHKKVQFIRLTDMLRETVIHKVTLDLPDNVDSVLDAWCEVDNLTWKAERNTIALELRLTVSMFASMASGEVQYFEQSSQMQHEVHASVDCHNIVFDPISDILSSAYNLVGKEKIDIRCEVLVKGSIFCPVHCRSISEISVDHAAPKPKISNKLFIYYGDPGESIWDIAKHYNTSAHAIWEENAVEDDVLPHKMMLLIPIV